MFPNHLTDRTAFDIARALLDGFDRHYRLFRETSAAAKRRFEDADWHGQQRAQRERIEFYDLRVNEAVADLRGRFKVDQLSMDTWQQAKLHYIGLLTNHHQPELAETFFNSVTAKLLDRSYFHNDFIFVRPAVSTEYIENDAPASLPTYRAYYPSPDNLHRTWLRIVESYQLTVPFADLPRDVDHVVNALMRELGISAREFGALISCFSLASGVVGLAVAPFMDRFDRRQLLLFCYAGFALGTLACGLSEDAGTLLWARVICGAFGGVAAANFMFELPIFFASQKIRTGTAQWFSEFVATFGLLMTIRLGLRYRPDAVPALVAAWIVAGYWFTSSTSFANPAITIARSLSDSFSGIAPADVPAFIAAQLIGASLGAWIGGLLFAKDVDPAR